MVRLLTFYFDVPSSSPAKVYTFSVKMLVEKNKTKTEQTRMRNFFAINQNERTGQTKIRKDVKSTKRSFKTNKMTDFLTYPKSNKSGQKEWEKTVRPQKEVLKHGQPNRGSFAARCTLPTQRCSEFLSRLIFTFFVLAVREREIGHGSVQSHLL